MIIDFREVLNINQLFLQVDHTPLREMKVFYPILYAIDNFKIYHIFSTYT